jgi:hypothetical protein
MRNIEVVIDASGSANLGKIECHLVNMKMDPSLQYDNITVSFFASGQKINKNLNALEIPLTKEDRDKLYGGGDNYNEIIKEKLESKPDVLMFISDYMDRSIEKASLNNTDAKLVFICTQSDKYVEQFFLAAVKDLENVRSSNTDKYTSIDNLFKKDLSINEKISKLRFVTSKDSETKTKP